MGSALGAMVVEARRAFSQTEWMGRVAEDPDLVFRKADRRRNVAAVVCHLALFARWYTEDAEGQEMTTRPGWAELVRRTGLSRSTVASILAWLRERGWLAVVETGTTEAIRAGLLFPLPDVHAGQGNRAAVYLLCVPTTPSPMPAPAPPPSDGQDSGDVGQAHAAVAPPAAQDDPPVDVPAESPHAADDHDSSVGTDLGPLRGSSAAPSEKPPAGARNAREGLTAGPDNGNYERTKDSSTRTGLGLGSVPPCGKASGRARLRVSQTARAANPVLRRLSARHVRSVLTPWWRAGWSTLDVLHALDRRPDGTAWPHAYDSADLRHVAGWIAHRLRAWTDDHGQPIMSPAQRAEHDRQTARAAQAAHRAERETALASAAWNTRYKADVIKRALKAPPAERETILAALDKIDNT